MSDANLDAKGAKAVLVRRTELKEGDIEREHTIKEEVRHLREKAGSKVRASFLHRRANVGANEERIDAQVAAHLGAHIVSRSMREDLHDLDIAKGGRVLDERLEQLLRNAAVARHEHAVLGRHQAHRLLRRSDLARIFILPINLCIILTGRT